MKKLLFIISVCLVMLSSCVSTQYYSLEKVGFLDYSTLVNNGIFVTESNSVNFEYKSVGSVYIELREGKYQTRYVYSVRDKNRDDRIVQGYNEYTFEDVVIRLGQELNKVGANGIINLKVIRVDSKIVTTASDKVLWGPGYIVTGMAIRK